jgi:hypothetical protein
MIERSHNPYLNAYWRLQFNTVWLD